MLIVAELTKNITLIIKTLIVIYFIYKFNKIIIKSEI
jgi:hypothetical protein